MYRKAGRAIPIDRTRIRDLAKELTREIQTGISKIYLRMLDDKETDLSLFDGMEGPILLHPREQLEVTNVRGNRVRVPIYVVVKPDSERAVGNFLTGGHVRSYPGEGGHRTFTSLEIGLNGSRPARQFFGRWAPKQIEKEIYSVLVHEITHLQDWFRMSDRSKDFATYVNRPQEVRAFMQQVVDEVLERQEEIAKKSDGWALNLSSEFVESRLDESRSWHRIKKELNTVNRRLILKAVARALAEADPVLKQRYLKRGAWAGRARSQRHYGPVGRRKT